MNNTLIITISKSYLLDTLTKNRKAHEKQFRKAFEVWKSRLGKALETAIKKLPALTIRSFLDEKHVRGRIDIMFAKRDKDVRGELFALSPPTHFLSDYYRTIAMVGRHQGDTLDLNQELYEQYVNDNWGWRRDFAASTTSYLA